MVIVTRYFGGILLGTGGLVRTYSDALIGAIEKSKKIVQTIGVETEVILEYNQFEKFQHYCRVNQIQIINTQYLDNIICKIAMEEVKKDKLITECKNKSLNIKKIEGFSKKIIDKSELK